MPTLFYFLLIDDKTVLSSDNILQCSCNMADSQEKQLALVSIS